MINVVISFFMFVFSVALVIYEKIQNEKEKKNMYAKGYIEGVTNTLQQIKIDEDEDNGRVKIQR